MSTPLIGIPLFGIGMTEAIVIGLAILVLFGATRLPKLGKGIGEGIRNFKAGITGASESLPGNASSDAEAPSKQS